MTSTVDGSTMWKNQTQSRIGVLSKFQPKHIIGGQVNSFASHSDIVESIGIGIGQLDRPSLRCYGSDMVGHHWLGNMNTFQVHQSQVTII